MDDDIVCTYGNIRINGSMEMEALWFGESEKAFFKFEDLEKNRKIATPLFPPEYYDLIKDSSFKYEHKKPGEIRLVTCDIAGMAGKENDASVYAILRLIPTTKGYDRYISYMESMTGGHTVTQAIRIRQLHEDFECDYIVLDTQNFGLGIYDQLTNPLYDKERNKEYEPISCTNDEAMAERCAYSNADKIVYSIKGNAKLNSEIAIMFRDGFKRGKIRMPINEIEGREHMRKFRGYENLPEEVKAKLMSTYTQFTLLVNEMINLEAEYNDNGQVKLREPNGKRKDRFSSTSYGNYVATLLERKLNKVEEIDYDDDIVYF